MLKWHKVGCYATAFARVGEESELAGGGDDDDAKAVCEQRSNNSCSCSSIVSAVQQRRDRKAQSTHWLAVGAKDGKVSLWDIY